MSSYLKPVAFTTLVGLSGSLLYYCYNKSSEKKITSESIGEFVNPGLVTGLLVGSIYSYTGKPVFYNLLK